MRKGLLILHTGNGKGKTTAALGMAMRALGHGLKVCIIQFIKGTWKYGELFAAERFDDLAAHIRAQIDQSDEPQTRNSLRCRLGQVHEDNLEDLTSAVDVYEEALGDEGGGIVAPLNALEKLILEDDQRQRIAEILEPIYRETDEWKKLIRLSAHNVLGIHPTKLLRIEFRLDIAHGGYIKPLDRFFQGHHFFVFPR